MEELKNKILQAMQSDFIGDVQFDEDDISQMKEDCKKFYRAAQNTWSKYYKREDICELIVLIVKLQSLGTMKAKVVFGLNFLVKYLRIHLSHLLSFKMILRTA